ncbi:MAG TPA: UpxY family transcription antiterminator [Candidatus Angelobacter sp.]
MFAHSLPAHLLHPQWFVLFVRSNQEKTTIHRLADREIEHFLPCYRSVRQWRDRRVTLEMPLFPGYVFVRLPFSERGRVLTLPNVVSLVGAKNSPSVISEEEIGWIRQGMQYGNVMPHPHLTVGQRVRIVSGALSGMQGVLVRKQNSTRVVVCLDSISRGFVVEVDLDCLEPIRPPVQAYKEAG